MFDAVAARIATTPASAFIQDVLWIIPTSQTIHILAVAIVLSSVAMIDLRILGLAGKRQTMTETAQRYVPWIWTALVILLLTGMVQITGEPVRSLTNPAFQVKMLLLLVAMAITIVFQVTVKRNVGFWDASPKAQPVAKVVCLLTLALWFAIAIAGRWIAYMVLAY